MVVTHWESSSRPLHVKTVWRDGHHHVVLHDDDLVSTARSNRSRKSAKKPHPPVGSVSFEVPSVQLLLANLRNPKIKRCKTEDYTRERAITIDIVPGDPIRFSDLNKQVTFDSVKPNRGASLDEAEGGLTTPPPFSYDHYCLDHINTSLTERVMIWLDLAVQNRKQFKNFDIQKRVVTAQACPMSQRQKTAVRKPPTSYKFDTSEKKQQERSSILKNESIKISSCMECDHVDILSEKSRPPRQITAKRQLHIFLPSLPKKTSESSLLSSKDSSLLFHKL